ncbi:MAG: DUF5615 family PIN-like protein [Bacteroidetes bacterium]|nr:DUF5615 family PIN-like protein [Bacteroidota bacterium]
MKILVDQNISYKLKTFNQNTPFEFIHVSDVGLAGKSDLEIWNYSKINNLVILTFDNNFYNLSLLNQSHPKILLLLIGNSSTKNLINVLLKKEKDILEFITGSDHEKIYCLKIIQ